MSKEQYVLPSIKKAQKRTTRKSEIHDDLFDIPEHVKNLGNNRNYYLRTYGCQANERDGEVIAGILELLGYTKVEDETEADIILLNTCAIREGAQDKVFGELGQMKRLKRENPDLILGVCGCMVQQEVVIERILKTYPHVDLVFGTHNIHRLPQLLGQVVFERERVIEVYSQEGEVIENLPSKRDLKHKAWINIMYGCDKFCTYCIVPYTRGKERSRLMEDIMKEIDEVVKEGYQEITLLGQNVNAYGKDLGIENGFAQLLEAAAKSGIPRVRFMTSHPWDFSDEMIDVIAKYDTIMPSIHLPVQSGNSDVLKLMGRRYSIEEYKTLFDKIKAKMPEATITTDIIVGFPNETEEQFQDTLDLYNYCKFDLAFTFIYSPREGTPAAKMEDNISEEVKHERLERLNELVTKYSTESYKRYQDQVVKVLVDGPSKRNDDIYSGYTEENKLVNFKPTSATIGEIVKVKITETKAYSMNGVEVE